MKPFIMAIFGLLALLALSMYPRRGSGFWMSFKGFSQAAMAQPQYVGMKGGFNNSAMAMQAQQAKKEAMLQNLYDTGRLQQRKFGFSKHARRV